MAKVKHIGLIKFKDGVSSDQIESMFNAILDLSESIAGIEDYVAGPNNSPEGLADGFTHAFIMTFKDSAARDAYLSDPEHEKVKAVALPNVEKIVILDFEV
jgi:hypothetical protein